jgi:hypothetical protein
MRKLALRTRGREKLLRNFAALNTG